MSYYLPAKYRICFDDIKDYIYNKIEEEYDCKGIECMECEHFGGYEQCRKMKNKT